MWDHCGSAGDRARNAADGSGWVGLVTADNAAGGRVLRLVVVSGVGAASRGGAGLAACCVLGGAVGGVRL